MVFVPSIFIALLTLTSWTLAANAPRSFRQPADGKAFYTVYPSDSVSVSTIEDFVKKTVGTDGVLPSTDDSNNFVSWIVEASPAEVDALNSNTAINRVVHFDPPNTRDEAVVQQLTGRDDTVQTYAVFPVDRKDAAKCAETETFIKTIIQDDYYPHPFIYNHQTYYWAVKMTEAQRDEVAKGPGIRRIEADRKVELTRAMPPDPLPVAQLSESRVVKRELQYSTQKDAASELKFVSQPTSVPDLNKLTNYVYESHQGDGSYVFHLELGVAFKSQASEFPNVVPDQQHLQTDLARHQNWKPWEDHAPPTAHGTCTADKAVGAKYGSSKKAKLVVVQIGELGLLEINEAIRMIMADVTVRADRKKRSVVSMSMIGDPADPESDVQELLEESLQELFDLDVPVITGSGNNRRNAPDVDTVPAQWARPTYPLIVVGSVDFDGKRSDFSQGGTQVTVHAPGKDVTCVPESGDEPSTGRSGVSFAAPLVAGEVANLLSYDTVPFDTSDGNLVGNLRQYLAEDRASWKRVDQPAIWNGVDEAHDPTAADSGDDSDGGSGGSGGSGDGSGDGSSNTPPPLHKECAGLGSKKYVSRSEMKRLIEDEFCPAAVKQGTLDPGSAALMRPYNSGKPDAVDIAIEWQPGVQFTPNLDDCTKYLLQEITDGCDGDDQKGNPENFKGGGFFSVGDVTYRITPTALRQPPGNGKRGGCDCTYNFADTTCVIWGGGWSGADTGSALKHQLAGCALFPTGWSFDYGLGSDGREWTAHAETGIGQRDCVGHAGVSAGGPSEFVCHGNG